MSRPAMHAVTSRNIAAIGYEDGTLYVQFNGAGGKPGATYKYPGVDKAMFDQMKAAKSAGQFFHEHIKSRQFEKLAH